MINQVDLKQLRIDIDRLSSKELSAKYPGFSAKALKDLNIEELEKRISKAGKTPGTL